MAVSSAPGESSPHAWRTPRSVSWRLTVAVGRCADETPWALVVIPALRRPGHEPRMQPRRRRAPRLASPGATPPERRCRRRWPGRRAGRARATRGRYASGRMVYRGTREEKEEGSRDALQIG